MKILQTSNKILQTKMSKMPESRLKIVGEIDGYVEQMLADGRANLESLAKLYKTKVNIAQKGDAVLVNAGPRTSMFNLKDLKHGNEFYENIINNIRENGKILLK